MRTISKTIIALLVLSVSIPLSSCKHQQSTQQSETADLQYISWSDSLTMPDSEQGTPNAGRAGMFSGFVGEELIMLGGANFAQLPPWQGGSKTWYDNGYSYTPKGNRASWQNITSLLPTTRGYGCSVTLPEGLLCIGGSNEQGCTDQVLLIKRGSSGLVAEQWPSLPVPLAHSSCAVINGKIYIAGGETSTTAPEATNHFMVLDTKATNKGWTELKSWPGAARSYAVSAAQSDGADICFFLFSGRDYGTARAMQILDDGYIYNPRLDSWKTIQGLKFPVMGGTAFSSGSNHIILVGGSSGLGEMNEARIKTLMAAPDISSDSLSTLKQSLTEHFENAKGFTNRTYLYHTVTNTIICGQEIPIKIPVTTNLVKDANTIYITSGEINPGVRTPSIITGQIVDVKKGLGFLNSAVIVFYFIILAGMGYYFARRQKNSDDYFKGGGRLPWWAVGLSIFGTTLSAITFMAIPSKAFATDWSYMLFNTGIILVAPIIVYLFIPYFRKQNITTAYEYLEERFNSTIRVISSLAFILFQVGRMGVVLFLPAIALNVVTGLDIFLCIGAMGIFGLVYTMFGGIEAVVWTDAFQVVVLLGGAALSIVIIVLNMPGGFSEIITVADQANKFDMGSLALNLKQPAVWTVLIASFFTNLTTYGSDQTMVQRYLTTTDIKQARKSVWTNVVLTVPATIIFFFIGTALFAYYKTFPSELSYTISDSDAIFPWYIYTKLPNGITGLLISGIFAAAMSTLSSSMNSAATAYTVDIHSKITKNKGVTSLSTARISTLIIGTIGVLFAFLMATWNITSLWDEFNKILGLILGGMGAVFLLGMVTKRANSIGVLAGIVGSVLVQLYVAQNQPVHLLLYSATGFVSCFVIGYVVSLFTRNIKF